MGKHEEDTTLSNPNLYPQELQLKLYQAFIFSIPILFSVILFLLFYLFYLKRRAAQTLSASASQIPRIQISAVTHQSTSPTWNHGIKGEINDKLKVVYFDEQLKAKDSICCVCLGEYEMREELRQLPTCKHVFHWDCIRHWLRTNATCPLCRGSVINMGRQIRHMPNVAHNSAQHAIANNSNVHNSSATSDDDLVIHVLA